MVHILDLLLVILGAALAVILFILFRSKRRRTSVRPVEEALLLYGPAPQWKTAWVKQIVPAMLLFGALFASLWWRDAHQPQSLTGCVIKGNINFSGERIFHVPGDRYYDETIIDERFGERWFCSVSEALAAGWRPAKV